MAASLTRTGRHLFAASVAMSWVGTLWLFPHAQILREQGVGLARVLPPDLLVHPVTTGAATVGLLAALVAFLRRPSSVTPVAWMFALFFFAAHVEASAGHVGGGSVRHGKFLVGAALGAMVVGRLLGADRDADAGRRRALDYALGAVAALYVWAGLIKLWEGGPAWVGRANVSLLVYERSFHAAAPIAALREWASTQPLLTYFGGLVVLTVELGGAALLVPRLRIPFAVAATGMHAAIGLLLGYLYLEWILGVWGLVLWSRGTALERSPPG